MTQKSVKGVFSKSFIIDQKNPMYSFNNEIYMSMYMYHLCIYMTE